MSANALELVLAAIVAWLAIGVLGLVRPRAPGVVSRSLFSARRAVALALAVVAFFAIGPLPQSTVLPLGLPDLPFHLRLDSLSAFFLLLLGAASAAHLGVRRRLLPLRRRHGAGTAVPLLPRVSRRMALVLIADDAYLFMVAGKPWRCRRTSS